MKALFAIFTLKFSPKDIVIDFREEREEREKERDPF